MKKSDRRGQFYLFVTIILLSVIVGIATLSNFSQKQTNVNFQYVKDELNIESEKVLDYGLKNNKDTKVLLTDFTKTYSNYSDADNFYYVFGDKGEITISGYKKFSSGTVLFDLGNGSQEWNINEGVYASQSFSNPKRNINLTIDEIIYDFTLRRGENFYFILSKETNGEVYILSNSYYDENLGEWGACGNGVIESGETCDDGNTNSGDGCSSSCQIEDIGGGGGEGGGDGEAQ